MRRIGQLSLSPLFLIARPMERVLFYAGLEEEWALLSLHTVWQRYMTCCGSKRQPWFYSGSHSAKRTKGAALGLLASILATLQEGSVRDCLAHARKHLEEELRGPRSAVLALTAIERARASCNGASWAKSLAVVVHAVTDVVVWRIQVSVPFGNRDLFLSELEMACAGSCDVHLTSRVLLSHYKCVAKRFPSAFLSRGKTVALRSGQGCRARKEKSRPIRRLRRCEQSMTLCFAGI